MATKKKNEAEPDKAVLEVQEDSPVADEIQTIEETNTDAANVDEPVIDSEKDEDEAEVQEEVSEAIEVDASAELEKSDESVQGLDSAEENPVIEEAENVEKPATPLQKQALALMEKLRAKQIWYCPKTGYWFTREDYALAHQKSTDVPLESFKK